MEKNRTQKQIIDSKFVGWEIRGRAQINRNSIPKKNITKYLEF